eukprot:9485777-Pyramimonas_sp.AAC.1
MIVDVPAAPAGARVPMDELEANGPARRELHRRNLHERQDVLRNQSADAAATIGPKSCGLTTKT